MGDEKNLLDIKFGSSGESVTDRWIRWKDRLGKRVAVEVKPPQSEPEKTSEVSKKRHTTSYEDTAAYGRYEEDLPAASTAFIETRKKEPTK
jgi:hypothetical protein